MKKFIPLMVCVVFASGVWADGLNDLSVLSVPIGDSAGGDPKVITTPPPGPQILTPPDGLPGDHFGRAVAISGNTLAVGAPNHFHDLLQGAVYIYRKIDIGWVLSQEIGPFPEFRSISSIALHGDHLAVGTLYDEGVTVYRRESGQWEYLQTIEDPASQWAEEFGISVAVEGDTMVIGNPGKATGQPLNGRLLVYEFDGLLWQFDQEWIPTDGSGGHGRSISMNANIVVCDAGSSTAIFVRTVTGLVYWGSIRVSPTISLIAAQVAEDDTFVGRSGFQFPGYGTGAATVWERSGPGWDLTAVLHPQLIYYWEQFGPEMDISGDTVLVGNKLDDLLAENAGTVYAFKRGPNWWALDYIVDPPDPQPELGFGTSIASTEDVWVVGAQGHSLETGAVYVYDFAPLPPPFFADGFESGDTSAWNSTTP